MQGLLRIRFPVDPSKSKMRGQRRTFSLASPVVAILRRSSAGVCYSQFSIALSTMPSSAAEADTLHPYLISRIRILILSLQVCLLLFFHRIIGPASSPCKSVSSYSFIVSSVLHPLLCLAPRSGRRRYIAEFSKAPLPPSHGQSPSQTWRYSVIRREYDSQTLCASRHRLRDEEA
jgi:hypothetical protein